MDTAGASQDFFPDITFGQFGAGCSLFAVPLSPEPMLAGVTSAGEIGKLDIQLDFEEALEEPIHLFCLGVFNETIEIDKLRRVKLSFIPKSW